MRVERAMRGRCRFRTSSQLLGTDNSTCVSREQGKNEQRQDNDDDDGDGKEVAQCSRGS